MSAGPGGGVGTGWRCGRRDQKGPKTGTTSTVAHTEITGQRCRNKWKPGQTVGDGERDGQQQDTRGSDEECHCGIRLPRAHS